MTTVIVVVIIIGFQLYFFLETLANIKRFKNFFPARIDAIEIIKTNFNKTFNDQTEFAHIQFNEYEQNAISPNALNHSHEIYKIALDESINNQHPLFVELIQITNRYLEKNSSSTIDFKIIKELCDRHVTSLKNQIERQLNFPLYIGLAGTFIGMISSLFGFNIDHSLQSNVRPTEHFNNLAQTISPLIEGVGYALLASLIGLSFVIFNANKFNKAISSAESAQNKYFDLLQVELLPIINTGISDSLNKFKHVLNEFIRKFDGWTNDYHDTAETLNENLHKQHLVLKELNKLNLPQMGELIAETFSKLRSSSEELNSFIEAQREMNQNFARANEIISNLNRTMEHFADFNARLHQLSDFLDANNELHRQLKDSLDKHFPTIVDHRELWRQELDEINTEFKQITAKIITYFTAATEQFQYFANEHNDHIQGISELTKLASIFLDSIKSQNELIQQLSEKIGENLSIPQEQYLDLSSKLTELIAKALEDHKNNYNNGER